MWTELYSTDKYSTENLRSYPEKMRCISEIKAHIKHFKKGECSLSCSAHPYLLIADGVCTIDRWISSLEKELEVCLPAELAELCLEVNRCNILPKEDDVLDKLIMKLHKKQKEKKWPKYTKKWFIAWKKQLAGRLGKFEHYQNLGILEKKPQKEVKAEKMIIKTQRKIHKIDEQKKKLEEKLANYYKPFQQ